MAKIGLVTFGSAGDVHPMLAIGQALRQRRHRVVVLTNPAFAKAVQAAGLDFYPVGTESDFQQTVAHPKLWHPIDGFGVMWRYLLRPALQPTFLALKQLRADGQVDCALAAPVAMGARVAQEAFGLPLVSVYTAATMLRTVCNPMTLAQWRMPHWVPNAWRAAAWRLLDQHKLNPLVTSDLNALRQPLNLPSLPGSVFGTWMHSPQAGVALFPQWFAPAVADWPAQLEQCGFPVYTEESVDELAPELMQFLDAGQAPVVFMPGTAATFADRFFSAAAKACRETGLRGVLLGAVSEAVRASLGPDLHCSSYASFSQLLPRAAALVHHGGIGSTAQALRAGIPQVVVPQAYDQFDNAMRLEHLGVGRSLDSKQLDQLGAQLTGILANPGVATACAQWAPHVDAESARAQICDVVERLV